MTGAGRRSGRRRVTGIRSAVPPPSRHALMRGLAIASIAGVGAAAGLGAAGIGPLSGLSGETRPGTEMLPQVPAAQIPAPADESSAEITEAPTPTRGAADVRPEPAATPERTLPVEDRATSAESATSPEGQGEDAQGADRRGNDRRDHGGVPGGGSEQSSDGRGGSWTPAPATSTPAQEPSIPSAPSPAPSAQVTEAPSGTPGEETPGATLPDEQNPDAQTPDEQTPDEPVESPGPVPWPGDDLVDPADLPTAPSGEPPLVGPAEGAGQIAG